MAETYRVGLLGHGTVGAAFAELLGVRADEIVPITGLRPEISAVLTRSRGSFDEILESSDLVVELIGGLDPARDYALRAMRAGRHVVSANKQLLSNHGEELWATAREHGVQLRFEGAVGFHAGRPSGAAYHLPYFGVVEALKAVQHQNFALLGRQQVQRFLQSLLLVN